MTTLIFLQHIPNTLSFLVLPGNPYQPKSSSLKWFCDKTTETWWRTHNWGKSLSGKRVPPFHWRKGRKGPSNFRSPFSETEGGVSGVFQTHRVTKTNPFHEYGPRYVSCTGLNTSPSKGSGSRQSGFDGFFPPHLRPLVFCRCTHEESLLRREF